MRGRSAPSFVGIIICMLPCLLSGVNAVTIRQLTVPRWVVNGTEEGVVLDCDYTYNENDRLLVLKWFLNNSTEPIYQWIPEINTRHFSSVLHGRVDRDFSISSLDTYSQYRALRITNPSPELSGTYTCAVSSFTDEDTSQMNMTVYVPAKHFYLNFTEVEEDELNVTCTVDGAQPSPQLQLYYITPRKKHLLTKRDPSNAQPNQGDGLEVQLTKTLSRRMMKEDGIVVLECVVDIPGSPYKMVKRLTYFSNDDQK